MHFLGHKLTGTHRGSPFIVGNRYRVISAARSYTGSLTVGEILSYYGAAVGIYDNISAYVFSTDDGQERTWILCDDEPLELWLTIFKAV